MFKLRYSFVLLVIGCSGAVDTSSSTVKQKLEAADARSRGLVSEDACAKHGWYGDGVCDSFCVREDGDCVAQPARGEPIVCAQFIEAKDGVCRRAANDPCRFQDPDCNATTPAPGPHDGEVCAAYIEVSDGVCRRPEKDPCRSQDPDCSNSGTGGNSGSGGTSSGSGGKPSVSGGAPSQSGGSSGTVCAAYIEQPDGVCKRPADDPCRSQDPDCVTGSGGAPNGAGGTTGSGGAAGSGGLVDCDARKVTCQTFAPVECDGNKVPSVINNCWGECVDKSRCLPDSGGGGSSGAPGADCDTSKVTCQTFAPVTCPDGQVPSVQDQCYGPCVSRADCATPYDCNPYNAQGQTPPDCPSGQVPSIVNGKYDRCVSKYSCEPTACLAYIENSDGVCKRPYNDPCRGQDPDCSAY
ncbi:MAG: hypothetical protein ACOY0T_30435 [Myxococcota bacterium]